MPVASVCMLIENCFSSIVSILVFVIMDNNNILQTSAGGSLSGPHPSSLDGRSIASRSRRPKNGAFGGKAKSALAKRNALMKHASKSHHTEPSDSSAAKETTSSQSDASELGKSPPFVPEELSTRSSKAVLLAPHESTNSPAKTSSSVTTEDLQPITVEARSPASLCKDIPVAGLDVTVEDLCRKKGLRRVVSVIQEDDDADTEADRIPDHLLTDEVVGKLSDSCKLTVNMLDKLQKHFNIVRDKLYRARCLGMDQGIEAVQKGESPFLEQHITKIKRIAQEELKNAEDLQNARVASILNEHETACQNVWDSVSLETARTHRLRKLKHIEQMIKDECEVMQNLLRDISARWKDEARNGNSSVQIVHGVVVNTGAEVSVDDAVADIWKLMKESIREKFWNKYLSPEAERQTDVQEREALNQFILEAFIQGASEKPVLKKQGNKRVGCTSQGRNFNKKVKGSSDLPLTLPRNTSSDAEPITQLVVEGIQVDSLSSPDHLTDNVELPGVQISIPEPTAEMSNLRVFSDVLHDVQGTLN